VLILAIVLPPAANAKTAEGTAPDLVVAKISKPPLSVTAGSKLKVTAKVKNTGAAAAPNTKLALYLGAGRKPAKKDLRLKLVRVKALSSGGAAKLKLAAMVPAGVSAGSYRLIACADPKKVVRETNEGNDCAASRKFALTVPVGVPPTSVPPAPPVLAPRAAFSLTDTIDWGFVQSAAGKTLNPGDLVTATLRAGDGIAGQAGYTSAPVSSEGFLPGATTELNFGTHEDDGQVTLSLPFSFPFGGINESSVSVSTNGWISFGGSPAWDYWNDSQPLDYRGANFVVGEFERGIMPYWGDLDVSNQGAGTGTVKEVVAPDGSYVAFQWDLGQHSGAGAPRRQFQLVLYPDGRFRLDYPNTNVAGGNKAFVGYSFGTGPASVEPVAVETEEVPASGLLFSPKPVLPGASTAPGQATTTVPMGSEIASLDPGCTLTTAPESDKEGVVSCAIPALAPGQQFGRNVTFKMPGKAPGQARPANFRYRGAYSAGAVSLFDGDEIDALSTNLRPRTIETKTKLETVSPKVGKVVVYEIQVIPTGALDEPIVHIVVPQHVVVNQALIGTTLIPCTLQSETMVDCRLPSGSAMTTMQIGYTPEPAAAGEAATLEARAQALNAPLSPAPPVTLVPVIEP
jgi:hypothetical protein